MLLVVVVGLGLGSSRRSCRASFRPAGRRPPTRSRRGCLLRSSSAPRCRTVGMRSSPGWRPLVLGLIGYYATTQLRHGIGGRAERADLLGPGCSGRRTCLRARGPRLADGRPPLPGRWRSDCSLPCSSQKPGITCSCCPSRASPSVRDRPGLLVPVLLLAIARGSPRARTRRQSRPSPSAPPGSSCSSGFTTSRHKSRPNDCQISAGVVKGRCRGPRRPGIDRNLRHAALGLISGHQSGPSLADHHAG